MNNMQSVWLYAYSDRIWGSCGFQEIKKDESTPFQKDANDKYNFSF